MERKDTLHFKEFTDDQKGLICSIINRFGTGQHPVCDERSFDGFAVPYLKKIINNKKFQKAKAGLSTLGKKSLEEIQAKL